MTGNLFIEASAGTGKTQALAERLIDLIRGGVKPQEIVALTFSRAAAGEIFERFVMLLAERAQEDPRNVALLRTVIETQHLSQIGTLDSFLMRIVRSFPLELGLGGPLEIMDDYTAAVERARVAFGILRRTDDATKRAFDSAFALAMNHENVRSFTETYRSFIKAWHERYLALPEPQAWGDVSRLQMAELGAWSEEADGLNRAAAALEGIVESPAWREFIAWVRDFRGSLTGLKGFAKKFLDQGAAVFTGATIELSFNRTAYVFGGAQAQAIRAALAAVLGLVIRMKLEMARGIYTLVSSFEAQYAQDVRQRGHLVFADIPRLLAGLTRDLRLALEYRLDAKICAWALDEFQDTSREQWRALSNILDEAKQSGGEKSVFIVGDRKQAIYGWRNGDVRLFTHERDSGAYCQRDLQKSWRYGPPIVQAINAIFAEGRLTDEFPTWTSPRHETAKPELDGFVQVVESPGPQKEDFVAPVLNALNAVNPIARGLSAAILVRTNDFGEKLAAELKRRGLEGVVWEGESAILDTPALLPFLDTLALADHPGDTQAYEHFRRSPLAAAKYGSTVPPPAEISGDFARAFTTQGLVRTFRALRATLPEDSAQAWSAFTEARFTDLLRAASAFELTRQPGTRLADFISYLASCQKRTVAEPGTIRILTIHRSKGLGFDFVILPLYEPEGMHVEPKGPLVADDWILPDPGARVSCLFPTLAEAAYRRQERVEQEALCAYYVALTRAKRALTIVLHPTASTSTTVRFSQFVREALPSPLGNPAWYRAFPLRDSRDSALIQTARAQTPPRSPRRQLKRRLPSLSFQSGESAGTLFRAVNARQAALARGVATHATYEQIEWLTREEATDAVARELVKPDGMTTLWREKAFEILVAGEWMSGRFDRVVFVPGQATVYDFKTTRPRPGESEQAFDNRLIETYATQMRSYRRAVAALTGLCPAAIQLKLLAVSVRRVIPID